MAVLNVTPDSFYAGSRTPDAGAVERRVRACLDEGAAIIDVGGYSSRPGADEVSPAEEWRRVAAGLEVVRRLAPGLPVSVDTFRASVVRSAVGRFGKVIVNDISAGELDAEMLPTVAQLGVPYVAMHMKGDPRTMQSLTDYRRDIVTEVCDYFRRRVETMLAAGIRRGNIVLDPGFGFAKTLEQNYELLSGLHRLCELGFPVLVAYIITVQCNLIISLRIHEMEQISVAVQILHVHTVNPRCREFLRRAESLLNHASVDDILQLRPDEGCSFTGFNVLKLNYLINIAFKLNGNTISEIACRYHINNPPKLSQI